MFAVVYISAMIITTGLLCLLPKRQVRTALYCGALLFGVVGFMMVPRNSMYVDTIRFFDTLDAARNYLRVGPAQAWDYLMNDQGYASTPVMGIVMYCIAWLRHNGWLTFLAAFADIGAGFYLIYQQSLKGKYNKKALIAACLFFLSVFNFNAGVSGIRSYMVCGLSVCVTYYYSTRGFRPIAAAWYLILILIHPFGAVAPILYVMSLTIKNHRVIFFALCIVLLLQQRFQEAIFQIIGRYSSIPFFGSIAYKSTQYFGDSAYIVSSSIFSRIRDIMVFCFLLLIIVESLRHKPVVNLHYTGFLIMLVSFGAGAFLDEQLFTRNTVYILFGALPFIYSLYCRIYSTEKKSVKIPLVGFAINLGSIICLIDNMRAGIRFEEMQIDWVSLCICIIIMIFLTIRISAGSKHCYDECFIESVEE